MDGRAIFKGTQLKLFLNIEAEGFDIVRDDFSVMIKTIRATKVIEKSEMKISEEERYFFTIDTGELGTGEYIAYVTAYIPDEDFDEGIRREVIKLPLWTVQS